MSAGRLLRLPGCGASFRSHVRERVQVIARSGIGAFNGDREPFGLLVQPREAAATDQARPGTAGSDAARGCPGRRWPISLTRRARQKGSAHVAYNSRSANDDVSLP